MANSHPIKVIREAVADARKNLWLFVDPQGSMSHGCSPGADAGVDSAQEQASAICRARARARLTIRHIAEPS